MKKPQIVLIHFAGGSSYSFRFLEPFLNDFELVVPELPGRGKRMGETLLRSFDAAAWDIYHQVVARLTSPRFLIYGHSLGAYLALKITGMLERSGRFPVCLLVGGNAGPGGENDKEIYLLGQDEFIREVKKLGGMPTEFEGHRELLEFFVPILKADFEVAHKNGMEEEPPVQSPLFAMMGSLEDNVDRITNWSKFTRTDFSYEILEGDHFFIYRHAGRIADIIKGSFTKIPLSKHDELRYNNK